MGPPSVVCRRRPAPIGKAPRRWARGSQSAYGNGLVSHLRGLRLLRTRWRACDAGLGPTGVGDLRSLAGHRIQRSGDDGASAPRPAGRAFSHPSSSLRPFAAPSLFAEIGSVPHRDRFSSVSRSVQFRAEIGPSPARDRYWRRHGSRWPQRFCQPQPAEHPGHEALHHSQPLVSPWKGAEARRPPMAPRRGQRCVRHSRNDAPASRAKRQMRALTEHFRGR